MIFIGATYEEMGLSPEQLQGRMAKWFVWGDKMEKQGIVRSGEALHDRAITVSGPDRVVTDGPFAESKELVGGYYIVTAESLEAVVEIAQDFPDYDLGSSVEIRELMKFDQ